MLIGLTAEGDRVRADSSLQSGVFRTADEVSHEALISQDAEETWLHENEFRDKRTV